MSLVSSRSLELSFQQLARVPTPLQLIPDVQLDRAGVRLFIKREDLIHPQISGNKWRKLKYNLIEAQKRRQSVLLTFGGAYSNHIYALAAAGKLFGFRTIGIIRGEETEPLNPTLTFARDCGMYLHYLDRETYRNKDTPEFICTLKERFGDFFLIPEGGSNVLAVKGGAEIVAEIDVPYDYICCPCGTGGTIAGLITGDAGKHSLIAFSALKGGAFLYQDVHSLLQAYTSAENESDPIFTNWEICTHYHFGGYAKTKPGLMAFIQAFEQKHQIPLEQVYTGKMLYGIFDLIQQGYFKRGTTIVAIHTGGLQGRNF